MNKKGQALVEFVLILPIFIFLIMAFYDFGMIFINKCKLENNSSDIIELYKNGKDLQEIKDMYSNNDITVVNDQNYEKITISYSFDMITPGLSKAFPSPYVITVERYMPNEE